MASVTIVRYAPRTPPKIRKIADHQGHRASDAHTGEEPDQRGIATVNHGAENRHGIGADAKERGVPKAQYAGFSPQIIEAEGKKRKNQRIANDRQAIGVGPERISGGDRGKRDREQYPGIRQCRGPASPHGDFAAGHGSYTGISPRGLKRTMMTAAIRTSAWETVTGT